MSHINNGRCSKCSDIFDRFPGFHEGLRSWFIIMQARHPETHISCAGRGKTEQEADFLEKRSRAHFGQSAHNYNAAIDLFVLGTMFIYDRDWFYSVLAPEVPDHLNWYGAPHSPFYELPHLEVRQWKELRDQGLLKLVEPK